MRFLLPKLFVLLWTDENAARRWLRMLVGALAMSGALYAEQLEPISHEAAVALRIASIVAGLITAAHGDPVQNAQPPEPQK